MSVRCELSEIRESTATFGCAVGFGRVGDMRGGVRAGAGSARGERGGVHRFGVRPRGDANFARVQDFSRQVAPEGMTEVGSVCLRFAVAVLANGSMSSNQADGYLERSALSEPRAQTRNLSVERYTRHAVLPFPCSPQLDESAVRAFETAET